MAPPEDLEWHLVLTHRGDTTEFVKSRFDSPVSQLPRKDLFGTDLWCYAAAGRLRLQIPACTTSKLAAYLFLFLLLGLVCTHIYNT